MTTPIIEIKQLKTQLGGHTIHDNLNLTIQPGHITGIIGGSGSGKTTLMLSILMLLRPTNGSIQVFGTDVTRCNEQEAHAVQHRWGVLFQYGGLFSSLTLLENVRFPLDEFTQLERNLREELALFKIGLTGLPLEAAIKYPSELSGGMRKRAGLARAIALDPDLLFLDEPTAGLDPGSAEALDELILQLRDNLGLSIVLITHDLDSLWRVADTVAFLGEGTVLAHLPMAELVKQDHPLIKRFFGKQRGGRHER